MAAPLEWNDKEERICWSRHNIKINTKLVLQHPIQSPPYSHNAIVDTGEIKYFLIPNTPLIIIKDKNIPLHVQLPNVTVLKSTHEGNIELSALPK